MIKSIFKRKKLLIILFAIISSSLCKLKDEPKGSDDCPQNFQDGCSKKCEQLKRILCYCKVIKLNSQDNHKCLCAPDKNECKKELEEFMKNINNNSSKK